ncbi:glycosyltransferase involved in cell wall biosynthesis [Ornithinimicrobium humiphilum]|uniref:D-inositol 3-phosphate glycosyltransferase n=1 Tax=Ornithinimicrobium humiphilum TaxID=125288 RepID=A0A543KJN1_9MICO|nr:glycosyltransferase [Ornithinimicrobium humiphilum]TQM95290.1 glycosyltransferase involved in cell wall biosynthesis [Ornithinimicrobium humiphilum]
MTNRPRVAIAHDYLTQRGGAERVVLALSRAFPEAPIYTTIYDPEGTFPDFADREIVTSPLSRIPALRHDHRRALPLLAPVSSRLRVDADVTVASSSGWAHGFATTGRTLVYCHNPARWLYQADEYLGDAGRRSPTRLALGVLTTPLRRWDRRAAARADRYLANSGVVRERVARAYGIEADVVPPPPGLDSSGPQEAHPELAAWADRPFWLVVSRLLPYKNVDVALEAFRGRPGERLVVVGAGPERDRLVAAAPDNVRIVSGVSDAELRWIYAHAGGLVAPSFEDFGLTPLEANAWGVPVVALRAGGYLDTVVEGRSGVFFDEPTPAAVGAALDRAQQHTWSEGALRRHADGFGEVGFAARIRAEVDALLEGRDVSSPGPAAS